MPIVVQPVGDGTSYNDAPLVARVAALESVPPYDDTSLDNRLDVLEATPYAKLTDLAPYAKLTDLPAAVDLAPYAKLTDLPAAVDLAPYAKLTDLQWISDPKWFETTGVYATRYERSLSSYYSALVRVELEYELSGTVYPFSWADFTEGADFTTSFAYNSFYNETGGVTRLIADANGGTIAIARSADRRRVSVSVLDLTKGINDPLRLLRFRNVKLNGIPCELTLDKSAIDQVVAENVAQQSALAALAAENVAQQALIAALQATVNNLEIRSLRQKITYTPGHATTAGAFGGCTVTASAGQVISHNTPTVTDWLRRTIGTPGATGGNAAGWRTNHGAYFRQHGFSCVIRGSWVNATSGQLFYGLGMPVALSGEATALFNTIGIGLNAADTNLQLIHNDASGSANKTDLGIPRTAPIFFELLITCQPGERPVVRITNLGTKQIIRESELTTKIPALDVALAVHSQSRNSVGAGGQLAVALAYWDCYGL
jgi:hypothetical protein